MAQSLACLRRRSPGGSEASSHPIERYGAGPCPHRLRAFRGPCFVVIPAYNRGAASRRAVTSGVAPGPRPPAQVIVVDDCSTDETAEARPSRRRSMSSVTRINRGAGAARNTAIDARIPALGRVPGLRRRVAAHTTWPRCGRVRADHVLLAAATLRCEIGRPRSLHRTRTARRDDARSPGDVATIPLITASGVMVRRDVAVGVGGFRPLHGVEDIDLWLRVSSTGPATSRQWCRSCTTCTRGRCRATAFAFRPADATS